MRTRPGEPTRDFTGATPAEFTYGFVNTFSEVDAAAA
jgi:hypothetical protein